MRFFIFLAPVLVPVMCWAAIVPADISAVRQGPVTVSITADTLTVRWPDESSRIWTAEFSLDTQKPLITRIGRRRIERGPQCLPSILG